jgi:hypothetical protein
MKKECKKLMSIGMRLDMARTVDEKDTKSQRKYENPILSANEDQDLDNVEHMYELKHYGDTPNSIVG